MSSNAILHTTTVLNINYCGVNKELLDSFEQLQKKVSCAVLSKKLAVATVSVCVSNVPRNMVRERLCLCHTCLISRFTEKGASHQICCAFSAWYLHWEAPVFCARVTTDASHISSCGRFPLVLLLLQPFCLLDLQIRTEKSEDLRGRRRELWKRVDERRRLSRALSVWPYLPGLFHRVHWQVVGFSGETATKATMKVIGARKACRLRSLRTCQSQRGHIQSLFPLRILHH